ncbi:helix-turn-helix transcriptional regulator [Enterococcus sp. HY326]|uniref:helix-turn-helix transcriptional regulator n=1 Tax=Enterococcus sp. HY326 TaxID=2971265 RepID=UPI00223EB341|nr:LuxR C-terminal-related transcriptional regulator [Enterococcus sp. HY326]
MATQKNNQSANQSNQELLRPQLMYLFDQAVKKQVIFVSAPAGFGKTTACKQWIQQKAVKVSWIELDQYDNNPAIFFRQFCLSLLSSQASDTLSNSILFSEAFNDTPAAHTIQLLTALARTQEQHFIILDNLDLIANEIIRDGLLAIQEQLPKNFSSILITRKNLDQTCFSRLSSLGLCSAITEKDLAFSTEEIKQYFADKGHCISTTEATAIKNITEGWPSGILPLAEYDCLDLLTADDPKNEIFIHYIQSQIWSHLTPVEKKILLDTSIVLKLTEELALRLTQEEQAVTILTALAARFDFVQKDEKNCFSYYPAFRTFLQREQRKTESARLNYLHKTAAHYFLESGDVLLSRGHALKSNDTDLINITNIAINNLQITAVSTRDYIKDFATFQKIEMDKLAEFPYPYLLSQYVCFYYYTGDVKATKFYLDYLYENLPLIAEKYPTFLSDSVLISFLDFRKNLFQLLTEIKNYPSLDILKERLNWITITFQLPFFHRSGRNYCELATQPAHLWPTDLLANLFENECDVLVALTHAGLLYEQNQLLQAEQLLTKLFSTINSSVRSDFIFCAHMQLSAIYRALEQKEAFEQSLLATQKFLKQGNHSIYSLNFTAYLTQVRLSENKNLTAKSWLKNHPHETIEQVELYKIFQHFTTARCLIASNQTDEAEILLKKIRSVASDFQRCLDFAEAQVLLAALDWALNRQGKALQEIESAILSVQESGFLRVFADEGAAILPVLNRLKDVLKRRKDTVIRLDYLNQVIQATKVTAKNHPSLTQKLRRPSGKLSSQQLKILSLLAQGNKNSEIAQQTGLTVSTVKYHLGQAYKKLQVNNAFDAILKCEEQDLFNEKS